jgi:acetone carboxylase, beta subunit
VGLIVGGKFRIYEEPTVQQMIVSHPIAEIVSIGAGGGTIAGVDPLSRSFIVGPLSAGSSPGPACYDSGGEHPTVTDADVVLGYIDPDYFLGGKIRLNKPKAVEAIKKHVADPLGLDVFQAAGGIKALIDTQMRLAIRKNVIAKGYDAREFVVMAIGGAGPTHAAGFTEGLPFKEVLVFPYSSVFCAFGATCSDIAFTHVRSIYVVVPPGSDDERKLAVAGIINQGWEGLENPAHEILEKQGIRRSEINIIRTAAMKYGKQLHEITVTSPVDRIRSPQDLDALIAVFEHDYEKLYTYASRYPGAGVEVFNVGVTTWVSKVKPHLRKYELGSPEPPEASLKGKRDAYFVNRMMATNVYEMDELSAGNVIPGPAIIESPTTTFVIPPSGRAEIDEYKTFRLKWEDRR